MLPKIISSQFCGKAVCDQRSRDRVKTFDMGNAYTRMQSETSEDETVGQSQKRNDTIVIFHKIGMGHFKEWYNNSRYFDLEPPWEIDVKLYVGGLTYAANLTVDISKIRGSDQIRVRIINESSFEICLGGEVYCVEGKIKSKFLRRPTHAHAILHLGA